MADESDGRSVNAEQLLWELLSVVGGGRLDLIPNAIGPHLDVELDGQRIGALPKPRPDRPWSEATFTVGSGAVAVALIWHEPVAHTDVFVERLSLRDGRSIDAVRRSAPAPITGYELRFRVNFTLTRGRLMPPLVTFSGLGSIAVWIIVISLGLSGSGPGTILLATGGVFLVAYMWTWAAATTRVHRYNIAHPELGDARRTAALVAAFLGFPLITLGPVAALLVVLSR